MKINFLSKIDYSTESSEGSEGATKLNNFVKLYKIVSFHPVVNVSGLILFLIFHEVVLNLRAS